MANKVPYLKYRHRDSVWVDADGDLWWFNTEKGLWQCLYSQGEEGFMKPVRGLTIAPNSNHGPYTCIHTNADSPGVRYYHPELDDWMPLL